MVVGSSCISSHSCRYITLSTNYTHRLKEMVEALEYDLQTAENEIVDAQQELFDAVRELFLVPCTTSNTYSSTSVLVTN